jgi:hypothetical protein
MRIHLFATLVTLAPLFGACSGAERSATSTPQSVTGQSPPIYFNHVEAYVSQATIDAFQTNAYLNSTFSDVQVRTTVRPDITYTGTYLNFHNTYLEFFPFGTFGAPNGTAGVAQGDEVAGGYEEILTKLQAQFGAANAYTTIISRQVNGVTVPWFHLDSTSWSDNSAAFGWWTQEYLPPVAGSTTPGTRTQFLAPRYAPNKLAQNVVVAVLALADSDRQNLLQTWQALGVQTSTFGSGFVAVTANDPDEPRAYFIEPATATRQGAIGYAIRLNSDPSPHTEQLGDATLHVGVLGAQLAVLWLVPPTGEEEGAVARFSHAQ